jgi:hypothetical protein
MIVEHIKTGIRGRVQAHGDALVVTWLDQFSDGCSVQCRTTSGNIQDLMDQWRIVEDASRSVRPMCRTRRSCDW